jgi:hypothetical protein
VEVLLSSFEEIKILGFSSEAALYEICARLWVSVLRRKSLSLDCTKDNQKDMSIDSKNGLNLRDDIWINLTLLASPALSLGGRRTSEGVCGPP